MIYVYIIIPIVIICLFVGILFWWYKRKKASETNLSKIYKNRENAECVIAKSVIDSLIKSLGGYENINSINVNSNKLVIELKDIELAEISGLQKHKLVKSLMKKNTSLVILVTENANKMKELINNSA